MGKRGKSDYYYRIYRIGNSVVSRYMGSGKKAVLAFEEDQLKRDHASFNKNRQKVIIEDEKVLERRAHRVYTRNTTIFKAVMLIFGYHTHKGQWRKVEIYL